MSIKFNYNWDKPQFVRSLGSTMESHNGSIVKKDIVGIINNIKNSLILGLEENSLFKFKGAIHVIKGLHPDCQGRDHITIGAKIPGNKPKVFHIYLREIKMDHDWTVWEVDSVRGG